MARVPASIQAVRAKKMDAEQRAERRELAGGGQFHTVLTPNQRLVLQHMEVEGGNPLTYRISDLAHSTGFDTTKTKRILDALYVKDRVERVNTGSAIYYRKAVQ